MHHCCISDCSACSHWFFHLLLLILVAADGPAAGGEPLCWQGRPDGRPRSPACPGRNGSGRGLRGRRGRSPRRGPQRRRVHAQACPGGVCVLPGRSVGAGLRGVPSARARRVQGREVLHRELLQGDQRGPSIRILLALPGVRNHGRPQVCCCHNTDEHEISPST